VKKISENKKMKITKLDKILLRCIDDMIESKWVIKIFACISFLIILIPYMIYEGFKGIFETINRLKKIRDNKLEYEGW